MSHEGITIVGAEIENFRRLKVARVEFVPGRGLVRVTGETANGKTSLLKAIAATLFGAGEIHPDSIHEDAESGRVTLRLSNGYTAERRLTRASPKGYLGLVGPDGPLKNAQTKLNEWVGPRASAPLEFFSLPPAKQRDALFAIASDERLPAKLEEIRRMHAEVYAERTPIISRVRHLASLPKPEGERPAPVDTTAELERLRVLQKQERDRGDARREADDARRDLASAEDIVATRRRYVEELERKLGEAKASLERAERQAAVAADLADEMVAAWEAMPDPSAGIEEVQQRLEAASAVQATIAPWVRWEEAQAERERLVDQEAALTAELAALKGREKQLLADAGIPVAGLSFGDDGEPLLNGRSLALASGRERIELAVAVAMAANPDLKICLLDEANDLGLKDLQRLDELAKEHGFQIWACRIGIEGEGEVVVENGEAWGRDDPVEETAAAAG